MARSVVSFRFQGGKAIENALAELGDPAASRRTARRSLKSAAQPIADAASERAPELTGRLGASIKVGDPSRRNRTRDRDIAEVVVGIDYRGKGWLALAASINEFGAVFQRAQPYMRPAMDAEFPKTPDRIAKEIWPEIEKSAARLAKRRAR